jgi:hypothetical protein
MSELSKNQLTQDNNNSFPNNNTGYITPTILRTFNQNMIDSLVDEIQYNVESASFDARINVLDPSGSAQALLALEQATASLNAYTQSQNSFNSSATASIVALQNFSSSLDTTYATDAQLSASVSALSSSVTVTTNGLSSSILALQQFSSSLDNTYATDTQLSASASTLQNNINTKLDSASFNTYTASQSSNITSSLGSYLLSQSFNTYTQSNDSKVNSLINATGSYATLTQLSASASTLQNNINGVSSQLNSYSSSTNMQLAQIQQRVSASATTGSNTFIGNQIVSGNVNIEGNITAVSASFIYITTVFETASVIFSSGSNQLGDELIDVQTLSGSVKVEGTLTVNGVPVQTSSFDASGYLLTSSFNTYTQSAASGVSASINTATQSLSSSIAVTTNNLDLEVNQKLDTGSFNTYTQSNDIKVNALIAATGSYAISSSVANTFDAFSSSISLTYATLTQLSSSASILQNGINSKVENSTFNTYTSSQATINQGLQTGITIRLLTSSFNTYTSSNDSKVNSLIAATGSYITSAQTGSMTVLSSSFAQTASFALNVTPTDVTPFLSKSVFDAYTGSAALGVSESINSATQSLSSSIAVTTNNLDLEVNGKLDSSSFNTYTQSNDSKVNSLISATGSYITSAQTSSMSVLSSSFAVTASFAENVTPTDVSMFVSQSTFNAYTQSNNSVVSALVSATSSYAISSSVAAIDASQDARINSLTAQTSSYVTESETGSFATTGSNTFIGNQIISGNLNISGNITATSGTFQYVETIFETASTIYSSGSNQFGDDPSDVQTLYGSVNAVNRFTASGLNYPTADGLVDQFLSTNGAGNLSFSNLDTILEDVYTGEAVTKGDPLYISGSQGAKPIVYKADAAVTAKMPVTFIAYETIGAAEDSRGIVLGLIEGIDLTGYVAGQTIYVAEGGGYSSNLPSGSNSITQLLGVITKGGNGGKGLVLNPGPAQLPGLQTGYVWVGNTSNQPVAIATSSIQTDVSGYTTTASFNSYTSSNDSKVNSLIAATSSYAISSSVASITSASQGQINSLINATSSYITSTGSFATTGSNTFIGNQIISGNLLVSGANINLEVDAPALSIGTTNVKSIVDSTGSGVVSSLDITRLGAGPTGDLTAIRLQTLSGSDTTGDTLLSRVTTGVNRHTSTGMTGSVVNTQLVATWATGSGGTRVGYSSQVVANAQSQSSTLTLSAGNASSNNAGGTASIAAGLIRIGTNVAHTISTTGSFGPITIVGPNNGNALMIRSGSVEITSPQGSGSFYSNLPITSSAGRFNGQSFIKRLNIEDNGGAADLQVENNVSITGSLTVGGGTGQIYGSASYAAFALLAGSSSFATNANTATSASFAQTASFALNATTTDVSMFLSKSVFDTYTGSAALGVSASINAATQSLSSSLTTTINGLIDKTGSYASTGSNTFKGVQIISSSVRGEQYAGSVASSTASFDCSTGNFFTLVLGSGTNHISASNIRPGQTINVRVTTQSGNAVTCSSAIKQPSGSLYTPTNGAGTDILTFISYDTTLFMVATKTFI